MVVECILLGHFSKAGPTGNASSGNVTRQKPHSTPVTDSCVGGTQTMLVLVNHGTNHRVYTNSNTKMFFNYMI